MIEVTVTATIVISSILLFCYWFRYTCGLILNAATSHDYALEVAQAHQLGFPEAQQRLTHGTTELDKLKRMLDRDYAVLTRLMDQTHYAHAAIERRMLAIHYRLAVVRYEASRKISTSAARQALRDMSLVVAHFANSIGAAAAAPVAT
jgi:hypothetical protein